MVGHGWCGQRAYTSVVGAHNKEGVVAAMDYDTKIGT